MNRYAGACRGWSEVGGYRIKSPVSENPSRQGVRWNDKEDFDLLEAITSGVSIKRLAARHARTRTAILQRVDRSVKGAERHMESMR